MTKTLIALLFSFALVVPVFAQTGTPTSTLLFDQPAPDLAAAQSYVYKTYADGAAAGVVVAVTCSGTASPFVCSTPFPAFTPGNHSMQLSAANAAGEGAKSVALSFTFIVVPMAPQNLRIG